MSESHVNIIFLFDNVLQRLNSHFRLHLKWHVLPQHEIAQINWQTGSTLQTTAPLPRPLFQLIEKNSQCCCCAILDDSPTILAPSDPGTSLHVSPGLGFRGIKIPQLVQCAFRNPFPGLATVIAECVFETQLAPRDCAGGSPPIRHHSVPRTNVRFHEPRDLPSATRPTANRLCSCPTNAENATLIFAVMEHLNGTPYPRWIRQSGARSWGHRLVGSSTLPESLVDGNLPQFWTPEHCR